MKRKNTLIVFIGCLALLSFQFSFTRYTPVYEINFDWDDLSDTNHFEILYLHVNNKTYPNKQFVDKYVEHFMDSIPSKGIKLNSNQQIQLKKVIMNETNYSMGEHGIFHLNAGFIILKDHKTCASINIGCGYNQIQFLPEYKKAKYGLLNDIGFRRLEKFIASLKTY